VAAITGVSLASDFAEQALPTYLARRASDATKAQGARGARWARGGEEAPNIALITIHVRFLFAVLPQDLGIAPLKSLHCLLPTGLSFLKVL